MLNKATIIGRLGRDPETRRTGSGKAVCNFTVATDESYTTKGGEKKQVTEWHRIVAWAAVGEACQANLRKGSLVYVEGQIQTRQWDDRSGAKKTTTEINARAVRFLDGKAEAKPKPADSEWPDDSQVRDEDVPF